MGQRQHNVVVINGKHYSVDTGELLRQQSTLQRSEVNKSVTRLTPKAPSHVGAPQKVEHHPHHVDLRQNKPAATTHRAINPLSRNSADGITSARPKSIKTHHPATAVHAKMKHARAQDRAKQPHMPHISPVVARHTAPKKQQSDISKPLIDLGSTHHEARRLRAAQHRKHEQISKFAAARRASSPKTHVAAPQLEPVKFDTIRSTHPKAVAAANALADHPPAAVRITAEQMAVQQAIALHHPRNSRAHKHHNHEQKHHPADSERSDVAEDTQLQDTQKTSFWQRFGLRQNFASAAAISVTALVIVGYVTYLNIPNVAMRVAASRAGFDASLPAYTPDGFGFEGPIAYNSGQVVVDFSSHSDNRGYSIAQRKSSWDSKSLLENTVKEESDNYLTFQDRGLTIYVYDGSKATWVNRGVWYTIEGDSKLNTEQLLKIAASL